MAQLHTDKPYIVALSLHVWSVQAFLSLFSNTVMSSITTVMHMWSFCTRTPSGVQYELNRHYMCLALNNAYYFGHK